MFDSIRFDELPFDFSRTAEALLRPLPTFGPLAGVVAEPPAPGGLFNDVPAPGALVSDVSTPGGLFGDTPSPGASVAEAGPHA